MTFTCLNSDVLYRFIFIFCSPACLFKCRHRRQEVGGVKGRLDKSGENFHLVHLNKEQVCRKQPLRCKHVAQNCEFDCQGREIPDVRRAPRLGRNGK